MIQRLVCLVLVTRTVQVDFAYTFADLYHYSLRLSMSHSQSKHCNFNTKVSVECYPHYGDNRGGSIRRTGRCYRRSADLNPLDKKGYRTHK